MLPHPAHYLPLLPLVLLVSACSSSPRGVAVETPQTTHVHGGATPLAVTRHHSDAPGRAEFREEIRRVWAVLPAVYDSLGVTVGKMDQVHFVIGNEGFKVRRRLGGVSLTRYFECGRTQGGPNAETYELHILLLTQLERGEPGRTVANTTVRATARPVSFAGDPVACSSTGALESTVNEMIRRAL